MSENTQKTRKIFKNFRNRQPNLRSWKTGKSDGKGHGIWKAQKSTNPDIHASVEHHMLTASRQEQAKYMSKTINFGC